MRVRAVVLSAVFVGFLGVTVPDLDALHERMARQGCVRHPRETFGVRMAQYRDPDGLTISVSEEGRSSW
jgi:hypothetical protein